MSRGERRPLVWDVESVRRYAPPTADGHRLLQLSTYVSANVPWYMVMGNTAKWMLHVFAVFGSYSFMVSTYQTFTPRCYEYGDRHEIVLLVLCDATDFCFWTFPLLCALIAVITCWRHFYESRVYYECLLHRVMMNYDNQAAMECPLTWVFVLYGALAVSVLFFVAEDPMGGRVRSSVLRGMMIYIAPLLSFFTVFLSLWQVEAHLIPLPKFCETDPELAQHVMTHAVFAPEKHMRVALDEVEELLDALPSREPLTSSEYFGLIAEAVRREADRAKQPPVGGPTEPDQWYQKVLAEMDLVKVDEYGRRCAEVSRPEVLTWGHTLRTCNWWAFRLLHSRHFADERAKSFRRWARLYVMLSLVAILCITEVYVATAVDFLKEQHLL